MRRVLILFGLAAGCGALRTPPEPLIGVPLVVEIRSFDLVEADAITLHGELELLNQTGRDLTVDRVEWSFQTDGEGQVGLADGLVVAPASRGAVSLSMEIEATLWDGRQGARAEVAGTVYWQSGWRSETTVFRQTVAVTGTEPAEQPGPDDGTMREKDR